MDEDKGSIGGLKNPPPVTKKLFYASILFDAIGFLLCLFINPVMFILMMLYVGISKAYSWKKIRLKKYGFTGWFVVMLFQGGYTYLLVNMAASNNFNADWFNDQNVLCMILASLLIGASYPLTQIYQHDEDSARGDLTISYRLGIRGTFVFVGALFSLACVFAWKYFTDYYSLRQFEFFILCLFPVMCYFIYWFSKAWKNPANANYSLAMRMTFISSTCMIICFSVLFWINHFGKTM